MPSVGERLREAREQRATTIEEVAAATGIGLTYLQAMEEDAFDALPGRAFGKLYLRAYGEVLGFDPQPLIHHYDQERPRDVDVQPERRSLAEEPRRVEAAIARWRAERIARHGGREIVDDPEPTSTVAETYEEIVPAVPEVIDAAPEPAPEPEVLVAEPEPAVNNLAATVEPEPPAIAPAPEPRVERPATNVEAPASRRFPLRPLILGGAAAAAAVLVYLLKPSPSPAPARPPTQAVPTAVVQAPPPPVVVQAPAPKPKPARTAPVAPQPPSELRVPEFGAAKRLVDRAAAEPATTFRAGEVAWFSTRVVGGRAGERVRHVWIHEGRAVQSIRLTLGASDWRTYSNKTLWSAGSWAVEARDEAGRVLARSEFTCVR